MSRHQLGHQRGAVLVVCMIILLLLTIVGVSGARNVILQEKMTFASRDAKLALQVTEAALREAEAVVDGLNADSPLENFNASGSNGGLYTEGDAPADLLSEGTWDDNITEIQIEIDGESHTAQYLIEYAGELVQGNTAPPGGYPAPLETSPVKVFRIVARGEGMANTQRTVITHHGRRFE